jgi:hypothetical protein
MRFEEEQKRLEQAAGPHGPRTTELVGVDHIGLPSGIQAEDAQSSPEVQEEPALAAGRGTERPPGPVSVPASSPDLSPGDEAAPGTVGSGDDVCPVCSGSGKAASGGTCPNCRGTGIVTEGIGGG